MTAALDQYTSKKPGDAPMDRFLDLARRIAAKQPDGPPPRRWTKEELHEADR